MNVWEQENISPLAQKAQELMKGLAKLQYSIDIDEEHNDSSPLGIKLLQADKLLALR